MQSMASSVEVKQTTQFTDNQQDQIENVQSISDPTFFAGETTMYDNNSYLSRPVILDTILWELDTPVVRNYNPFIQLVNIPQFQERIKTFAYFRGKLKLKIVVNGSPFWYGRLIAAFVPFGKNNAAFNNIPVNDQGAQTCYLSQLPHVFIDPNSSNSVELEVPPFMVRNWLRTTVNDVSRPGGDFEELPHLVIRSINPLRNADSASTGNVFVTTFGWFEDVELAVPTGSTTFVAPSVSNQGGKRKSMAPVKDKESLDTANSKPTISSVSSTISTGLGSMASLPLIGPFMKAGSVASGAISNIAKMFGFSRPVMLADTHRFFPEALPNLSSTSGAFSGYKMSIDPLQGVTVDPRVAMLDGTDEMSIPYIASKLSYVESFILEPDTPVICSLGITPLLSNVSESNSWEQPSACSFAAFPFNYWRGTVKLKFQVVASSFHRARIALVYDPIAYSDHIPPDGNYHKHLNLVMDLEELDELELDIPWMSAFPYLKTTRNLTESLFITPVRYVTGNALLDLPNDEVNGILKLIVVNELVANTEPVTPVSINVYVSCPDLQVAFLDTISRDGFYAKIAASDTGKADTEVDNSVSNQGFGQDPNQGLSLSMGTVTCDDDFPKVFFGEDIKSFRSCVKRFGGAFQRTLDVNGTRKALELEFVPLLPSDVNGEPLTGGTNLSPWVHMLEYLRFAYFAQRGSIRSAYYFDHTLGETELHHCSTIESVIGNTHPFTSLNAIGTVPYATSSGSVINPAKQNDSMCFETPFYSSNRYLISCANRYGFDTFGFDQHYPSVVVTSTLTGKWSESNVMIVNVDMAAGDDFSFMGYIAAPGHKIALHP